MGMFLEEVATEIRLARLPTKPLADAIIRTRVRAWLVHGLDDPRPKAGSLLFIHLSKGGMIAASAAFNKSSGA